MKTSPTRTPCIGICSTTSIGDAICRGCKRYAFEVIRWNAYTDAEKEAVLRRIEALTEQILKNRFHIQWPEALQNALDAHKIPLNPALSPYCWLHSLLQKAPLADIDPAACGFAIVASEQGASLVQLASVVNAELLLLCEAHFDRYYSRVNSLA
ncbi:MAG: hypothetical protein RL572_1735 [Pseudomonadota bacterium]